MHLVHNGDDMGRTPGRDKRHLLAAADTPPCLNADSPRCRLLHAASQASDSYEMLTKNDQMTTLCLQDQEQVIVGILIDP